LDDPLLESEGSCNSGGFPRESKKDPEPGEEQEIEINKEKMKFCWIPKGKTTLGSPKTEGWRFDKESEHEFSTNGFWLGKYEVTQK
jgi:formylglycine-generating enzyme required for sulfatase activity